MDFFDTSPKDTARKPRLRQSPRAAPTVFSKLSALILNAAYSTAFSGRQILEKTVERAAKCGSFLAFGEVRSARAMPKTGLFLKNKLVMFNI